MCVDGADVVSAADLQQSAAVGATSGVDGIVNCTCWVRIFPELPTAGDWFSHQMGDKKERWLGETKDERWAPVRELADRE